MVLGEEGRHGVARVVPHVREEGPMSGCWDIDILRMNAEEYLVGEMRDEEMDAMMEDLFAYGRGDRLKREFGGL